MQGELSPTSFGGERLCGLHKEKFKFRRDGENRRAPSHTLPSLSSSFEQKIMADHPTEELDPLFDYSRVQPNIVFLDDDSESDSPPPTAKKGRNISKPAVHGDKKAGSLVEVIDCEDKIYEVDCFMPPMIATCDISIPEEDPAIKELRLKKEELASFVKADDIFRAVEEAARKGINSPSHSSSDQSPKPPPEPPAERDKIVLSVQNKNQRKQFRVFVDDTFERFFKMYAEKVKIDLGRLVFCFDGEKICSTGCPASLGMEDGDIIEVHIKLFSCFTFNFSDDPTFELGLAELDSSDFYKELAISLLQWKRVLQPVIYCTANAVFLCLSRDAKVPSANALSNRHFQTLLSKHFARLWGLDVNELDNIPVQDQIPSTSCVSEDPDRMGFTSFVIGSFPLGSPTTSASVITAESFVGGPGSQHRKVANKN
ncbi:hypothetical protein Dimus_014662 [Dionaea muscipula]